MKGHPHLESEDSIRRAESILLIFLIYGFQNAFSKVNLDFFDSHKIKYPFSGDV